VILTFNNRKKLITVEITKAYQDHIHQVNHTMRTFFFIRKDYVMQTDDDQNGTQINVLAWLIILLV
jgi:hypothetical protein